MQQLIYTGCSIPIQILIIISLYVRKTIKGRANHYFLVMNYFTLAVAVLDFGNGLLRQTVFDNNIALTFSYLLSTLYFLMRNTTVFLYLVFLLFAFRVHWLLKKTWIQIIFTLPIVSIVGLILSNPFHHMVFSIDLINLYQRQPLLNVVYALSAIYGIAGIVLMFLCIRFIRFGKWVCLQSVYVFSFIAVGIQYFVPSLQIEIFVTSLSLLLIALFVLRPEELSDSKTGLRSYQDYQFELKKVILSKQKLSLQMIKIMNVSNIKTFYGEESYLNSVREIAARYILECKRRKIYSDVFFEEPGNLYVFIEDKDFDCYAFTMDMISYFRSQGSKDSSVTAYLQLKNCQINLPNESNDIETILRLGHSFDRYMGNQELFCYGKDIIHQKMYIIESNLKEILLEAVKNERFEMYYQPIYDIKAGKFRSAEALIRLNDPEYGMIMPGLFIPAAEQKNMLGPIGEFVLEDVFRFVGSEEFKKSGVEFVEVNLSVQQAIDPSLISRIERLQEKFGVLPSQINFEVTESIYAQDHDLLHYNLEKLRSMGYQLSLDDYGTGYSNITRMLSLPLSIIKFDKSMVDAADNASGLSVLEHSVIMMRDIRKATLVEGVETKEKAEQVIKMGVEYIQGFYYAKPLPVPQFLEFIATHNQ